MDTINRVFSKKPFAIQSGKNVILIEVRDCVLRNNEPRLNNIRPQIHLNWIDMRVEHGYFCLDEQIAIPKAVEDAVLEGLHSIQPGSFAMISLAQILWRP